MRGAHGGLVGYGRAEGIIPADAGSTKAMNANLCPKPDHPRGCGEHLMGG